MNLKLHHVGVVVEDIAQACGDYVQRLGYEVKSEILHDPIQTARVQFLRLPTDSVYLELVSPDGPSSKLANALKNGGGLNHICYATADIDSACQLLRSQGMFLLRRPVSAVAFSGRRIAWFMGKDRTPVELVEMGPPDQL